MQDSNISAKKEIIDAVVLANNQNLNNNLSITTSSLKSTYIWIWLGLFVLLLFLLFVIFFLPHSVEKNISSKHSPKQNQSLDKSISNQRIQNDTKEVNLGQDKLQKPEILKQMEQQPARLHVEELLTRLINLETKLQNHAVKKWALEEYTQAVEQGRVGDEYFRQRQYMLAEESFKIAIAVLKKLEGRIEPTLEQALSRGQQALLQGDQVMATQQFELAKSIQPNNIQANNGLKRASTITQLFKLLRYASGFESHGQLLQAKSAYQEARILDPLSNEVISALARVESKLRNQEFEQIIATAYKALQNNQYSDAREAFNSAKAIKPNDKQVTIGLNKVAQAIHREKINNLLYEANHFVELQQWEQAATSFEKILQLDSQHTLAKQEHHRSLKKANILVDLKIALESADLLFEDQVLNQAEDVLQRIESLESPGSIIEKQSEQLKQRVRVATTPIPIILESDGNTQVTLFKVARLGAFKRHKLQLRPGPYVMVGTRNGYRDVRITFQVSPSNDHSLISIRCEEPI